MTVEEAASFLGVKPGTVYLWAESARIPSYKIGSLRRFRLSDLEEHLGAHRQGDDGHPPADSDWSGDWSVGDGIIRDRHKIDQG